MKLPGSSPGFWREAFTLHGSVTPHVAPSVATFGFISVAVCYLSWRVERFGINLGLEVAPFEIAGAALGLLLVLRTNAGYERWWEARKLWGGIVNQSRNLAISALSYGPAAAEWQDRIVRWTVAFSHVARQSLRGEPMGPELTSLLGAQDAERVNAANHPAGYVALRIALLLEEACRQHAMSEFAFLQIDKERASLIDHIGGCERILRTPLPLVYSIKIRRFIALFLLTVPFALLHRTSTDWLVPFITMLVAYPLVALDQIGIELQNPFNVANLSHLPLTDICATIERNLLGLLDARRVLEQTPDSKAHEPAYRGTT